MDDFSFVGAGAGRPGQQPQGTGLGRPGAASGTSPRPVIPIPSFAEVAPRQAAPAAMDTLFRPQGLFAAHRAQQQQQHQPQQQQQPQQPGRPPPSPAGPIPALQALTSPPHAPYRAPSPTFQQQQQQPQQQHHPQVLQPPHGGGPRPGGAPSPHPYPPPAAARSPAPAAPAAYLHQGPAAAGNAGASAAYGNAIVVSKRQQGNPVLRHIKNVRWVMGGDDVTPDYLLGANSCALFLSLRYHLLHPQYIHYRIKELQRMYALRVLLVHIDVEDVVHALADVTKVAVLNDFTLVCAWTPEEAGRYLETFKAYENKPASSIQERSDADYASRLAAALTAVRAVNRTDALALGAHLGSLADIVRASREQLSACPGIGPTKLANLWDAFHKPLRKPAAVVGTQQGGVAGAPGSQAGAGAGAGAREAAQQQQQVPAGQQQQQQQRLGLAQVAGEQRQAEAGEEDMQGDGAGQGLEEERHDAAAAQEPLEAVGDEEGQEGERGDEEGGDNQGGDLVYMASQMMLRVQAGAMVTGALDSEDDEGGAGDGDDDEDRRFLEVEVL